MAAIQIPYGKTHLTLNIADERLAGVLRPAAGEKAKQSEQELVIHALENPIGSPRVSELAKGKKRILVITSDHTRPVPSAITLPLYLAEIRRGAPDADIRILIATGMHRPTTEAEMRAKFGDQVYEQEHFIVHSALDEKAMVFKGILPSGGELWLNNLIDWAELVVSEGFIEPHFFAGFSGGRKSILPGIASAKTVLYNHNAVFIANKNAAQGSLAENPIHKDMVFAAQQAGLCFILNVLIDADKHIIAAYAGDLVEAHKAGCAECLRHTQVNGVQADIAVTSNGGYPLDQNVYQSVKGMTAGEACVREGGVLIMCAALGDGHGGDSFYHWFADRKNADEVARDIENIPPIETHMDQWEAQILARVMRKAHCVFVTGEENKKLIEDMHLTWAGSLEQAVEIAEGIVGQDAKVTVIPDGVGVVVK